MPSLWHYNGRARAEKVKRNQPKPVRDYSFPHTRFLSLLRHIGFPLHFRTGAPAPKIWESQAFSQIFYCRVFHVKHGAKCEWFSSAFDISRERREVKCAEWYYDEILKISFSGCLSFYCKGIPHNSHFSVGCPSSNVKRSFHYFSPNANINSRKKFSIPVFLLL